MSRPDPRYMIPSVLEGGLWAGLRGALAGTAEVERLRAALVTLAKKIPAADPGPARAGDPGYVTNRMIGAIALIASRVPKLPDQVQTVLRMLPAGGIDVLDAISTTRLVADRIRVTVSQFAGPLATAISAYATIARADGGGTSPTSYPMGTIATWDPTQNLYRVAVPKDPAKPQPGSGTHREVEPARTVPLQGYGLGVPAALGAAVQVVTEDTFNKASRPWYKSPWFYVPAATVGVAGVATVIWILVRRRRRKGR